MKANEIAAINLGADKTRKLTLGELADFYKQRHPEGKLIQDAILYTTTDKIIWKGDVDLVRDADTLMRIAEQIGKVIYIFTQEGLADFWAGVEDSVHEDKADMLSYAKGKVCVQTKLFEDGKN